MEPLLEGQLLDSPSPYLLQQREIGYPAKRCRFRRKIEEKRLSRPRIVRNVPVSFTKKALVTCMDIDRIEADFLLCGSARGSIQVLSLASSSSQPISTKIPIQHQHSQMVNACQWYSASIGLFLTSSQDGTVKLWDLNANSEVDSFPIENPSQMHWNEIDRRNPLVAVSDRTSHARLLDLRVGSCVQDVRHKHTVTAVRWYPSQVHLLATGDARGVVRIWDIRSGRRPLVSRPSSASRSGSVGGIRFTPDGLYAVSIETGTSSVTLWDAVAMDPQLTAAVQTDADRVHSTSLRNFSICDEGSRLRVAVPSAGEKVTVLAAEKSNLSPDSAWSVHDLCGHFSTVSCCQYRPDVQELYTCSLGLVLCWGSEGERARASLEQETSRRKVLADEWSDED